MDETAPKNLWHETRTTVRNKWWRDTVIQLDGYRFINCRFDNCEFKFATADFELINCYMGGRKPGDEEDPHPPVPLNFCLAGGICDREDDTTEEVSREDT